MKKIRFVQLSVFVCALLLCISACGLRRQETTEPTPVPTVWLITAAPTEAAQETEAPTLVTVAPAPVTTPSPAAEAAPAPTTQPAQPEAGGETAPEETPDPARFIKINTSTIINITKHPGGEVVRPGDSTLFTARADGIVSYEWRFVSPDYTREVLWNAQELGTEFPGLRVAGGATFKLELYNIPIELNGWYAVCLFADADGGLKASDGALIQVGGTPAPAYRPAAAATPAPTAAPTDPPAATPAATPDGTQTETPDGSASDSPADTPGGSSGDTPSDPPADPPADPPSDPPADSSGESGAGEGEGEGGKG